VNSELTVIVPTRSRPEAVDRVIQAWHDTDAFMDGAHLVFVADYDDPRYAEYQDRFMSITPAGWSARAIRTWQPLVPKLNAVALDFARSGGRFALGFAGDDHLPRTRGWVRAYLDALHELGTGIVYGDDGHQHENIPTQWVMTADIVRELGAMVPAPVEHLYCDNAVRDLGREAGCLRYLPEVLIEHMHPVAGKATMDAQYERVNSQRQNRGDRQAYRTWRGTSLFGQAWRVKQLREQGKEAS
jgi:hypothetical protein